jgi:hypothetical protein
MNINIDTGSLLSTAAGQTTSIVNGQTIMTSVIQPAIVKNNGNPFDVTIRFQKPHDGIKQIALKNAQIPIGFYNIRSPYNTITLGATTYTITPGNYGASNLISALNTATSGVGTWSINSLVSFVSSSGSLTLTVPTGLSYPTLANFLGYTQSVTGTTLTAPNPYLINFDTYINIYLDNIGRPSIDPSKSTFNIPQNGGTVIQWAENNKDEQSNMVNDNASIDRLIVAVYDRYGQPMNNNGLDWSFTIRITTAN